jgi:2-hydroxy-4-carboxymuconate semialdehyde hemiacetal dehydrogenase
MSEFGDAGFAIVGPGAIGDVHATALHGLRIPVRAVVGPVREELAHFAAKHKVPSTYTQLEDLLADDSIDAVIVATPSHLHAAQTMELLAAGKHVLTEIPLGLDAAAAHAIAERATQTGRIAMGGYTLRYWQPHLRLQEVLADKDITPTQVVVRSMMLRQSNEGWTGRQRDWTDNVLWHHGGHAMDAALWHLREPTEISVRAGVGAAWPGNDTVMDVAAVLTTPDNRVATVTLSYHSRVPVNDFLVVSPAHTMLVTEGQLVLDGELAYDAGSAAQAQSAAVVAQDRDFASAVVHGTVPATTVKRLLPVMDALDRVAASG